jgi:hypothetical protein
MQAAPARPWRMQFPAGMITRLVTLLLLPCCKTVVSTCEACGCNTHCQECNTLPH